MEGQKRNIRLSECDSRQVTEILDNILDTRDEFLFRTVFRYCEIGYLKGEEYKAPDLNGSSRDRMKKILRTKSFWLMMAVLIPLWIAAIIWYFWTVAGCEYGLYIHIFSIVLVTVVAVLLGYGMYVGVFEPANVPIYDGKEKDMILWEDREDHKYHLWSQPVFFTYFSDQALNNKSMDELYDAKKSSLCDRYLEAARDLSWIRCLSRISEELKPFADAFREGNIAIEIQEDGGCNETNRNGFYTILFTGTNKEEVDVIVPVEEQNEKRSITVPYAIGKEMVDRYRKTGVLDLGLFDGRYEEIKEAGIPKEMEALICSVF